MDIIDDLRRGIVVVINVSCTVITTARLSPVAAIEIIALPALLAIVWLNAAGKHQMTLRNDLAEMF